MENKKCIDCGLEKPLTEYQRNKEYWPLRCKDCIKIGLEKYLSEGINHKSSHKREKANIETTRMLLTKLGYDVEKNIYDQFKERLKKKGVFLND